MSTIVGAREQSSGTTQPGSVRAMVFGGGGNPAVFCHSDIPPVPGDRDVLQSRGEGDRSGTLFDSFGRKGGSTSGQRPSLTQKPKDHLSVFCQERQPCPRL